MLNLHFYTKVLMHRHIYTSNVGLEKFTFIVFISDNFYTDFLFSQQKALQLCLCILYCILCVCVCVGMRNVYTHGQARKNETKNIETFYKILKFD